MPQSWNTLHTRRDFLRRSGMTTLSAALSSPLLAAAPLKETPLLQCTVAGTTHVKGIEDLEPFLVPGCGLFLQRQPQNPYDALAIRVFSPREEAIGYIPRAQNEVLAHLMDAGLPLNARLIHKQWSGYWLELQIRVNLLQ
jgi:hypothetical protein